MTGILLRCFDTNYDHIAGLSRPSAKGFCEAAGLQPVEVHVETMGPEPYMTKVKTILRHLSATNVDYIIYSDVDIIFSPRLGKGRALPEELFSRPLCISTDSCGICCGFMVLQRHPDVLRLLEAWVRLGYMIERGHLVKGDQATLKLLHENFRWVQGLIGEIPQSIVSNPETRPKLGWLAHHYWSCGGEGYWGAMRTASASEWAEPPSTPLPSAQTQRSG